MNLEEKKKHKKTCDTITITTGDIDYNIRQFNKRMGTNFPGNDNNNPSTEEAKAQKAAEQAAKEIGTISAASPDGGNSIGTSDTSANVGGSEGDPVGMGEGLENANLAKEIEDTKNYINYLKTQGAREVGAGGNFDSIGELKDTITDLENYLKTLNAKNENLLEAKRIVKRYYVRPQNKFAGNKTELLKILIDLDDQNCSVYTLKNLADNEDVEKLTNKDIIYYYDDGILYDKNHVKIFDYDLGIKREEERKAFPGGEDQMTDKNFIDEYSDRLTKINTNEAFNTTISSRNDLESAVKNNSFKNLTESDAIANSVQIATTTEFDDLFEESFNSFDLAFDSFNAAGELLNEAKEVIDTCCICGEPLDGYGNNPAPYKQEGRCCDSCNIKFVIPARMEEINNKE